MACEFFDDGRLARCGAVEGLLIPSHHEREHYCRTDGGGACPTRKLYQLRGGTVPQSAYYAQWIPPAPADRVADRATSDAVHLPVAV
jgi:hypothetical protein